MIYGIEFKTMHKVILSGSTDSEPALVLHNYLHSFDNHYHEVLSYSVGSMMLTNCLALLGIMNLHTKWWSSVLCMYSTDALRAKKI